jgi:hypothetical protein
LVKTDAAPTLIGLVFERSRNLEISRFPHCGEMSEMLALEEFGRGVVDEGSVRGSTKNDEFINVEFVRRFRRARFVLSH